MDQDRDDLKTLQGWQMSTDQLKARLGYPRNWPDDGVLDALIGNTIVYVNARNPVGGRKKHRAFAVCAHCGKHVPAGRLHQHLLVHGK